MTPENSQKLWKIIQDVLRLFGGIEDTLFHIKLQYSTALMRKLKINLK